MTEKDYDADELGRFPKGAGFPGKQSADWGWVQHILASLNDNGRAAIVLDTGAASRGSGSANTTKEKQVRKWFVDNDLIEGVIYLPENLFYNTTAPGIILFLKPSQAKGAKGKIFLLNASREFEKGDPKNYIPMKASPALPRPSTHGEKKTNLAHCEQGGDCKERLQHFAKPVYSYGRRGRISSDCGDCRGVSYARGGS